MKANRAVGPALAASVVAVFGLALLGATARGPIGREIAGAFLRATFWTGVVAISARIGAALTGSTLVGLAHLAWDGAAGLPLLVASWLVVGFLPGGFARVPIVVVLAAFAGLAVALARRDRVSRVRDAAAEPAGIPGALAAALATGIAVLGLAWDRVPPVFFDTLAYHWAQPDLWIVEGRIAPVDWSALSWSPPGMSVLYGVGLSLGGERLAGDANLIVGLMLLALAWDLGRRRAGAAGGLAALAVLASFPIVIHALGIPAADLGHGLFVAGSLGALVVGRGDGEAIWRRRAAWLAAGAALTKYLGLVVPVALGAAWLAIGRDRGERASAAGPRIGRAVAFVLPALLLLLPWCLADAVVTGNPVAPVGAGLVTTAGLAEGGAAAYRTDARGGFPNGAELRTLGPRLLGGEGADSPFYPVPAWGLMPVVVLLALPLARRGERGLDLLALAAVVIVLWFVTYRWERFLVAPTFLLAVALGGLLASTWRRGGIHRLATLLAVLIGVAAAVGSLDRIAAFTGGGSVFLGREGAREFYERAFVPARIVRGESARLGRPPARILFVGEMRHYGVGTSRVAPTGFNVHPLVAVLGSATDAASARAELRRRGFTHLLVDLGWVERSGRSYPSLAPIVAAPARFEALLRSLGAPLAADAGVALYEIAP